MNLLGRTTSWSNNDMQLQLSHKHTQGLLNKGFTVFAACGTTQSYHFMV